MRGISSAVIRSCLAWVNDLNRGMTIDDLPIDIESLARRLNVSVIEPAELSVDGYVGVAQDGKLAIRYRRSNSIERNRFTIAHEIGHLLIAEVTGASLADRKMRTGYDQEELVANRLAAEILIPEKICREKLSKLAPSWSSVQSLRRLFSVSAFSLLRRSTELNGIIAIFGRQSESSIEVGGRRRFTCDATTYPSLRFNNRIEDLFHIVENNANAKRFELSVWAGDNSMILPCEIRGSMRNSVSEAWVYGWSSM